MLLTIVAHALNKSAHTPCVTTISAVAREFGGKKALFITLFEVAFGIILGGLALRLLTLVT